MKRFLTPMGLVLVMVLACSSGYGEEQHQGHHDVTAVAEQEKGHAEHHGDHASGGHEMHMSKDDGEGSREENEGHEMHHGMHHGMEHGPAATEGLIRYVSPETGYPVVIGRKNPLPELVPELVTDGEGRTVKVFRLKVQDVRFEIYPGKFIEGWGFGGSIPGPTIRVKEGDRIRVVLENDTDTGHTLHIHGQRKPVAMDGVPYLGQKPVEWGDSYAYEFEVNYPGTHWYHCHVDSGHHVDMGMYGAFIVEPKQETISSDREYTLILDEWPTGHVHVHGDAMPMEGHEKHGVVTRHEGQPRHEHAGETPGKRDWYPETYNAYQPVYDGYTINGRAFPFTEPLQVRKGEKLRIRMINAGYESHFMHIHAHKMTVAARDGWPVEEPAKVDVVEVGPGQRVDVIIVADNPGVWPFHCHDLKHVANDHIYPGGMLTFLRYID